MTTHLTPYSFRLYQSYPVGNYQSDGGSVGYHPGPYHAIPVDMNNDGNLDLLVSWYYTIVVLGITT